LGITEVLFDGCIRSKGRARGAPLVVLCVVGYVDHLLEFLDAFSQNVLEKPMKTFVLL
jgi:hypothetical protein